MKFERIERLPPYILSEVTGLMREARQKGEDVINLGMGNPDLPTPDPIVAKLIEAAQKPKNHQYSLSRGIPKLRAAICQRYQKKFGVSLDPEREAIVTMGAKEGLSHLILATTSPGDVVFVPNPTYPIHSYSVVIAGGDVRGISFDSEEEFLDKLRRATKTMWPKPKTILLSFPSNPTTQTASLDFFTKVIDFARDHEMMVIHDFAYADLVFDGYKAPSVLQVPGAKDLAVELYSMSKSYSMPGWRVAFCVGNAEIIAALTRIKSYLDYGVFQPIQIAATIALNGPERHVTQACEIYRKRRDVLCDGLRKIGWELEKPKATMFVWAKMPEQFQKMGSNDFSKLLLKKANVMISPGIGFGEHGEGYVRFALVENEKRIRQAVQGIKKVIRHG